jgi:hypothetical protein
MNFELKVKEITKETYILTSKINDKDIINNLIKSIKECKNSDLNYKTNVKGVFTGFKSLIKNVYFVDFLKIIQPSIRVIYTQNFIHLYMYIFFSLCMCIYMYIDVYMYNSSDKYIYIYIYIYKHIHTYTCVYIYIHRYIHVYI